MNEQTRRRMKSDLVIAFGFSRENAEEALRRYVANENLNMVELDALHYLENKDPFNLGVRDIYFPHPMIEDLEHLNFRITEGK